MDSEDPLDESIRNLPEVPDDRRMRKRKNVNSTKGTSTSTYYQEPANNLETADQRLLEIKLKLAESTGGNATQDFTSFDELFSGDLPCTLLYLDRNSSSLRTFQKIDELSEYIKTADKNQAKDGGIAEKLLSAPVGRLAHFATLGKYLRGLYEKDKLMDVRIEVDGTAFMAHRVALCCHSGYLRDLLFKKQKYVKIPVLVKIVGVSAEAFWAFLEYVYTGEININSGIVADLYHISEYLDVKLLRDKLASIVCDFTLEESIKLLLKRPRVLSEKPYSTAFAQVLDRFITASMIIGFLNLDVEIFCSLLQSDALRVSHEFEAFQVAVRWIVHGGRERVPYITRVMNNIRFCYMSQEELFHCLEETSLFLDHTELRDLILIANWVLTAMRLDIPDPFSFIVPPYRQSYSRSCQKNFSKQRQFQRPQYSPKRRVLPAHESPKTRQQASYPSTNLQPSTEPVSVTPKKSSPRHGKPVIVEQDQIRADFSRWRAEPVLIPPGIHESSLNPSPKYGKPVVLPPEIQLPETHFSIPKPETKNIERPTMSPASHRKPTIWSPTSSKESSPSNSTVIFPPCDFAANDPVLLSSEAQENISNHSRYAKPILLPPLDEQTQRTMSSAGHPKPTTGYENPISWSPSSSTESPGHSSQQKKPLLLLNELREFLKTNIVHRPSMSPAENVEPNIWSPDSNEESYSRHSSRHAKPGLLPPDEAQGKGRQRPETKCVCRTTSPASHARPSIWTPNSNQCSNPKTDVIDTSIESSARIEYNTSQTRRVEYGIRTTGKLQTSDSQLNFKASGVLEVSRKEDKDISHSDETRLGYRRYIISETSAKRVAKPVMSPTEVRPGPAMSKELPFTDIIVVGCFEDNMTSNNDEKSWADFCIVPEQRQKFAVARVGRKLYVIGGCILAQTELGQGVTNSALQMDCIDKKWEHVSPMKEARMCHSACVLGDNIYVFGGLDTNESPLTSCECYNTCTNTWSTIASMPVPIYAGSAAGFGGKCYIAGGLTRTVEKVTPTLRMTMICFDPKKRTWSVPGYLRMPLCHASLVSVQGRLLLCGGATYHDDRAKTKGLVSVANIDEYNVLTNSWRFLTKMATPRQEASVVAVGSKLYVIGGKDAADDTILQSVECYDTIASKWKECPMELPPSARWIKCVSYQNMK